MVLSQNNKAMRASTTLLLTCNYVVQKSRGHTENAHQEVAHGEVKDEQVGDSPHVFAPQHNEAHHSVPHHANEEDQQVRHDEDGCCGRLMQVKSNICDVVPGYERLHGGVVKSPVLIQLSQVVLLSFIHFKSEKWKKNREMTS